MTQPQLPATHSFMVYETQLEAQRQMAAALGYAVTEAPVLPRWYVTWEKIGRVVGTPPVVGELWVDVSRHNWPIDVKAFKAAGVKRVYARATLGANGIDDRWVDIRNAVLAEGLPLGAYHYFIWNEDPLRQAENFKRVTLDFCTEGPVVDAERRRNVPTADPRIFLPETVDKGAASANLLSLLNAIGGADQPSAGIYTSKTEWDAMFNLSAASVAEWWKWVAHYRNGTARWNLERDLPDVPAGWHARVWQYRVAEAVELTWHPRALDLNRYQGETPVVAPPPPPITKHTMRDKTNQQVLNAFNRAFSVTYWEVIVRAGLASLAANRPAAYSGPAAEDLPGLAPDEKDRLIAAL